MKINVIIQVMGFLIGITGVFMLTSVPFSMYYNEGDLVAILISSIVSIIVGWVMWYFTRKHSTSELGKKEGYIIVSLIWIIMSAIGALPFMLSGATTNFTDAYFETMSGFTTTGASILTNIEIVPKGILYWRSLTHWIGGMGIIVLAVAILPFFGMGGMQLFSAESTGVSSDKLKPKIKDTASRLWIIYVFFTVILTVLLMIFGMNFFDAICHSFGTIGTGGFSTKNASVAFYKSPIIEYTITFFMFISSVSFTLHYFFLKKKWTAHWKDNEFQFYIFVILSSTLMSCLYLSFVNGEYWEHAFRKSIFSVVSILSTTGFVVSDYEAWGFPFPLLFLILLLFGGCAGSTAGGIKMIRHQLLLKNALLEAKRILHPNAVINVRNNGKSVTQEIISKVSGFILLYLSIFAVASLILTFDGNDIKTSLGSVAACMAGAGPGLGTTGPIYNFAHLNPLSKWILSFMMLIGRLELYTILILLSPHFWKKY